MRLRWGPTSNSVSALRPSAEKITRRQEHEFESPHVPTSDGICAHIASHDVHRATYHWQVHFMTRLAQISRVVGLPIVCHNIRCIKKLY